MKLILDPNFIKELLIGLSNDIYGLFVSRGKANRALTPSLMLKVLGKEFIFGKSEDAVEPAI